MTAVGADADKSCRPGSGPRSRRSRLAPVEEELPLGEVPTTVNLHLAGNPGEARAVASTTGHQSGETFLPADFTAAHRAFNVFGEVQERRPVEEKPFCSHTRECIADDEGKTRIERVERTEGAGTAPLEVAGAFAGSAGGEERLVDCGHISAVERETRRQGRFCRRTVRPPARTGCRGGDRGRLRIFGAAPGLCRQSRGADPRRDASPFFLRR